MFLRNGLEPWHLLIVAVVLILLFGSKKLPDTARALGKSLRILKSETKAMREDSGESAPAAAAPAPQVTPAQAPVQTAAHTPTDAPPRPAQ
ncbi:Sec-independent protein translocase subunit TatA [Streptomyces sp. NPDC001415]